MKCLTKISPNVTLIVSTDTENLLRKLFFPRINSLEKTIKNNSRNQWLIKNIQQNHILEFFPLCVRGGLFSSLSMWVIRVVNSFRGD